MKQNVIIVDRLASAKSNKIELLHCLQLVKNVNNQYYFYPDKGYRVPENVVRIERAAYLTELNLDLILVYTSISVCSAYLGRWNNWVI